MLDPSIHQPVYVSLLFPLAIPDILIYKVPEELADKVKPGMRVEAPLKNKLHAAIVFDTYHDVNVSYKPRKIISLIDDQPIISIHQFKLWQWIANYYCCTLGEVMHIALPSGLKLSSETKFLINETFLDLKEVLTDNQYILYEALTIQKELAMDELQKILNKKTIYPEIKGLLDKGLIYVKEELVEKYQPKFESYARLKPELKDNTKLLGEALDKVKKSELQTRMMLTLIQWGIKNPWLPVKELYTLSAGNSQVLNALLKKQLIETEKKEVSRLGIQEENEIENIPDLSSLQSEALKQIKNHWSTTLAVLLHGVTGSGKTRIYMELIQDVIHNQGQVLYLLPEIALTTQIVQRLVGVFGDKVQVYHSRMTSNQRVEMWHSVQSGIPIVISARSGMFLPFSNLQLIIIDEEHDTCFKQQDPSPRYNARDASIYMASLFGARVLLGSATPSLESYFNARNGKYGLVEIMERFGEAELPDIEIVDLRKERKAKTLENYFSKTLRNEIDRALVNNKQVLIFQNRRGYAPSIQCQMCGWVGECEHCDLTLTKHKFLGELKCHYCGYKTKIPAACPSCGSDELREMGYGTEKIEDVIKTMFPMANVGRLDFDTARNKSSYENIILDFQLKKIDVLVGTQMITKGLDFDNIHIVGVLNADLLLFFPDFRASERAFQLLTQVAGRAGRRKDKGKVIIQTSQPEHPVIVDTVEYNYNKLIARELVERKNFFYPPYFRLIHIMLKHKEPKIVHEASLFFAEKIIESLGNRVLGPAEPGIARLRGQYLRQVIVKLEKDQNRILKAKRILMNAKSLVKSQKTWQNVRINIDVDPY
ncbi:MAG TPA: primosomal protein N' [Saprospiraceae bacterium]|nr:primosomal protein N' [Saprospiraceae bacterium]